jgi:hypothetical protein
LSKKSDGRPFLIPRTFRGDLLSDCQTFTVR